MASKQERGLKQRQREVQASAPKVKGATRTPTRKPSKPARTSNPEPHRNKATPPPAPRTPPSQPVRPTSKFAYGQLTHPDTSGLHVTITCPHCDQQHTYEPTSDTVQYCTKDQTSKIVVLIPLKELAGL